MRRWFPFVVVVGLVLVSGTAAFAWERPVPNEVVDQWRPPEHRFAAGNRGVDFATSSGEQVAAAGAGEVSFVGNVGGTKYAVILHDNGLRTTYGNLDEIAVIKGQMVQAGEVLGTAKGSLHFGVREGNQYIDPNSLFGGAHLVPVDRR